MRATLTYSVPFIEVPGEAARMATESARRLGFCKEETSWISNCLSLSEPTDAQIREALDRLDSVRILLADIDSRLTDCQGVLSGYLKVMNANTNEDAILGENGGRQVDSETEPS